MSTAVWNLWYLVHLKIPHKICNNIFCELTTLFKKWHILYNIMYWEWLFPLVFLFLSTTYSHAQFVVLSLILFISYIFCMRLFLTWSPPKRISVVPHLTKHPPTLVALIGLGQWVHAVVAGSKASGLKSSTMKRTSSYRIPGLPNLLNSSQVLFVSNLVLLVNQVIKCQICKTS